MDVSGISPRAGPPSGRFGAGRDVGASPLAIDACARARAGKRGADGVMGVPAALFVCALKPRLS